MFRFVTAAIALLAPFSAQAQDMALSLAQQRAVDTLIERALKDDRAYEILESLTTEIGPRLAGSEDEQRARDWGEAIFKQYGFSNIRTETFTLPYWSRVREAASIVSPYPQHLYATALGRSVPTSDMGLQAEIVRFGTLDELKASPKEGLEGKIVFVDEHMTRTQDGSGYGVAVAKRSGAANEAGRRGAAAAIIRSVGTDSHRNPHTGAMNYEPGVPRVPIAAISNPDADQLTRALRISDEPVVVSLTIQTETRDETTSGNVIAEIPGETDEIIVVGGHLDSWDLGTGAVDDGAGVAITMAAAKLVDELRGRPKRTIRVVMWGAEEVGLIGARAYAQAHKDELENHVLAAESDFGAGRIWRFQTRFGEDDLVKAQTMARALRPLGVGPGDNNARGGPDVQPLRAAGVPVVTLQQDGTDYFDLHHTPDDTLDKVDPADLRQNVAAWAVMLYLASELPGDFRAPRQDEAQDIAGD